MQQLAELHPELLSRCEIEPCCCNESLVIDMASYDQARRVLIVVW
jgi:hypothetical protein